MKSILRIVTRYMGSAFFITIIIIFMNLIVFGYCIIQSKNSEFVSIRGIAEGIEEENGIITMDSEEEAKIDDFFSFAMLLDDDGTIIWSHSLPKELNKTYSLQDISALSKWYLNDYPVWTWNCKEGLFILGDKKSSIWKFTVEYPLIGLNRALVVLPIMNIVLLTLLCIFFGWQFYRSLKPVALGIESLSSQKVTHIKESGILGDLKRKINQTSTVLEKQKELLQKRDLARTQWIDGVSHDIRTPLSMIMGYSDTLEHDNSLSDEQHEKISIIKNQSIVIKQLIEDLNLTSKLEYQMQPLRLETFNISALLRQITADYYNENLSEKYSIDLSIDRMAETSLIQGDKALLTRAFRNLIGNSIRHNENGCFISIQVISSNKSCIISYSDNGKGLSTEIINAINKKKKTSQHIMGLYLIEKIISSHNGSFCVLDAKKNGMAAEIQLPLHLS